MRFFSGIGFRLNAIIIVLLLVTSIVVIGVTNYVARDSLEQQMSTVLLPSKLDNIIAVVDKTLIAPADALGLAVTNPFFRTWLENGENPDETGQTFSMLRSISQNLDSIAANLGSNLSKTLYGMNHGQQSERALTAQDSWFSGFGNSNKPVLINVYVDDSNFGNTAYINRRIDRNGQYLGMISIGIALEDFVSNVTSMVVGTRGATYMVDKEGVIRLHADKKLINQRSLKDIKGYEQQASKLLNSKQYQFEYTDENGEAWYVMSRYIPELGWYLVTKANKGELFAEMDKALYLTLGIALLMLLGGVGIGFLFVRSITKPLGRCVSYAEDIADGNLEAVAPADRTDELGTLSFSMKSMVGELRHKISEANEQTELATHKTEEANIALQRAEEAQAQAETAKRDGMLQAASRLEGIVTQVIASSDELRMQIEESYHGSEIQNERSTESATAMEQMNASVLEVASNASNAAESADNARGNAEEGGGIVEEVVQSINRVHSETRSLADGLNELGVQADNIGSVINVINDIADQTNLLALNAAIEAARAGDAGRGFAVVADEVRKLAEKTMSATKEVGDVVRGIQSGTTKNIERMNQTAEIVSGSTELAGKAGGALETILTIANQTADQVRAIATASEEQSAATEQITRGTEEVSRIATETAASMAKSAEAVNTLTQLSGDMQNLIEELKQA